MKNMFAVVFILGIFRFGSIGETEQPVSNGVEEEHASNHWHIDPRGD